MEALVLILPLVAMFFAIKANSRRWNRGQIKHRQLVVPWRLSRRLLGMWTLFVLVVLLVGLAEPSFYAGEMATYWSLAAVVSLGSGILLTWFITERA